MLIKCVWWQWPRYGDRSVTCSKEIPCPSVCPNLGQKSSLWKLYGVLQQFSICYLSWNEKLELQPFLWVSMPAVAWWGAQGSLRCATALWKQGATSHRGNHRDLVHQLQVPPKEWIFQSQCSLPPAFPPFFFCQVIFSMMDEIPALLCEANQLKLEQDVEVSMKLPILWLFPAQALLPDTFTSVCDWFSQLCKISEASVAAEHAAGSCASGRDGPVWDVRGSECPVKGICLCHLPPLPPPQSKIRWEFHGGNWREPFSKLGKSALFFLSCFNAQQPSSCGGCSCMMHQHKEPGVIKNRVNWACFGIWASGEQGEPVPPLPPAVAVPFSKILLSQLSTPYQSSAWSWWSYTTPNPALSTQVLYRGLRAPLFSSPHFWLLWEVLSISNVPRSCGCSESLLWSPWAECTPHQRPHCGEAGN